MSVSLNNRLFDQRQQDIVDMLCGDLIGEGAYRRTFACRIRPDLVVKVEKYDADSSGRVFCNVTESKFWSEHNGCPAIAEWLAPIHYTSPEAWVILQSKCKPIPDRYKMPETVPAFLDDVKRDNFGLLKGRLVCMDYAFTWERPSLRQQKVIWE